MKDTTLYKIASRYPLIYISPIPKEADRAFEDALSKITAESGASEKDALEAMQAVSRVHHNIRLNNKKEHQRNISYLIIGLNIILGCAYYYFENNILDDPSVFLMLLGSTVILLFLVHSAMDRAFIKGSESQACCYVNYRISDRLGPLE